MTPANAVAGFRKAGVYPFNRNKITVPTTIASKTAMKSPARDAKANSVTSASLPTPPRTVVFTEEQVAKFELRLEEGYDLPDPEYLQWLELNHPDALPSDRYDLTLNEPTSSATPGLLSVVEEFLTVTTLLPVSTSSSETSPSTSAMSQTGTIPSTPSTSQSVTNSATPSTSQSGISTTTPSTSPLTNHLVRPVSVIPKSRKSSQTVSGARVLTSADSLRFLEEKALKKKQEEEEKERRKQEREQKWKKKEEELKRKAELKAKRQEKRQREEEKRLKQLEKEQRKPRNRAQKSSLSKGAALSGGNREEAKESRDGSKGDALIGRSREEAKESRDEDTDSEDNQPMKKEGESDVRNGCHRHKRMLCMICHI